MMAVDNNKAKLMNKKSDDVEADNIEGADTDDSTRPCGDDKDKQLERAAPTCAEGEPWKSLSYIVFTIQFFFVTLDLFVETADIEAMHYAINSVEFATALYLAFLQVARIYLVIKQKIIKKFCSWPIFWLFTAFIMQAFVIIVTAYWFDIENDRATNYLEWVMFAVTLVWGLINPVTFSSVKNAYKSKMEGSTEEDNSAKGKKKLGPAGTIASVFAKHFSKTPFLFTMATIFASGNALLTTYQGAVINMLTRVVTRIVAEEKSPEVEREITLLSGRLAGVWLGANLSRFLFDLTAASMFAHLECWLKISIFEKAVDFKSKNPAEDKAGEYLARYTSDVNGVMALYSTLLRGVVMNVLLIITSFVFLAIEEWKIAVVTLGFLAMGVTSGPTDLAGSATADAQVISTKGMSYVGDELRRDDPIVDASVLTKRHEDEFIVPLKQSVWKQNFYANSVDSYIQFFASFLTIIVVITMTWEVYRGDLQSSDFLGIFFVYRQLQKPAMKISSVIKSAVRRSANVQRVNEVMFESKKED